MVLRAGSLGNSLQQSYGITRTEVAAAFVWLEYGANTTYIPAEMKKKSARTDRMVAQDHPVVLLAGGNPQIAKGEGDGPVREWLEALSGWKRETAGQIDRIIGQSVPGVSRAVKWNSPLYGVENGCWFLSLHVFTRSVKVTFFRGLRLDPLPPGGTARSGDSRWFDVGEGEIDEKQLRAWIGQAARLPGLKL